MAQGEAPKFTHDCESCEFLGHYMGYDVYWCRTALSIGGMGSILARFDNDGPDYQSMPARMFLDSLDERAIRKVAVGNQFFNYWEYAMGEPGLDWYKAWVMAFTHKFLTQVSEGIKGLF